MSLLLFVLAAWAEDPSLEPTFVPVAGAFPLAPGRIDARAPFAPLPRPVRARRDWTDARAANLERGLGFGAAAGLLWVTGLLTGEAYDSRPSDGLFVATDAALIGAATSGAVGVVFTGAAVFGK